MARRGVSWTKRLAKISAGAEHGVPVNRHRRSRTGGVVAAALLTLLLYAQEEKHLIVYTPQTSFAVTVHEVSNREYVSVLDIVQPLGTAEAKRDGDKWKLRFGGEEAQFQDGKDKAKIRGKNVNLGAPVVMENGVALIAVRGLAQVLPRLLNSTVDVRESARRVILGGAATDFTAELQENPSRLVLHFSKPVNPSIATEAGRLRMTFTKDPVVAPAATQSFGDKLITSASFVESNGAAQLTVSASAPLLATFSDENRTITLAAAPQAPVAAQQHPPAPQPTAPSQPAGASAPPSKPVTSAGPAGPRPHFLVVIDPAHGGDDRGALLADGVEEKEITLALARRLRAALEKSGVTAILLREGDTGIGFDQRAVSSNTARAAVFVSVHAGNVGRGVRVYTARLAETTTKPGIMVPWEIAQASYLGQSQSLAENIVDELAKRKIEHGASPAQLQPLNHITGAAVAVEFLPGKEGVASLSAAAYQQALCNAVAEGIAGARNSLEARK